jgi:hypothetical protein
MIIAYEGKSYDLEDEWCSLLGKKKNIYYDLAANIYITSERGTNVDGQGLLSFVFIIIKQFFIYFFIIGIGEWFAQKKGYNLFERTWLITVITLSALTLAFWSHVARIFRFP